MKSGSPTNKSAPKSRRTSVMQNNMSESTHTLAAETQNRRRVTNINPNIKISDITDVTRQVERSYQKAKIPKPDYAYKFQCSGEIGGDRTISGMHVEWSATFNKPVEQLIYPSLQRFDLTTYDQQRKQQHKLHGHNDTHFVGSSNAEHIESNGQSVTLLRQISSDIDRHTGIEDQKMFIHTPTWTMKLSGVSNNNATKYNTATSSLNDASRLRANSANYENPHNNKKEDECLDASSNKPIYASTAEEIDIEGERYLRRRIKEKYEAKILSEQAEREYLSEVQSTGPLLSPFGADRRRQRRAAGSLVPLEQETADSLYASISRNPYQFGSLSSRATSSQNTSRPDSRHQSNAGNFKPVLAVDTTQPMTPEKSRTKLNQLSPEEVVYNNQRKALRDMVPKDSDHLLDGLLYYRMHNDLNKAEIEEKKAYEKQKMVATARKATQKYSNNFTQRLSVRKNDPKKSINRNVNEMHADSHDDLNLISAAQIKRLVDSEVVLSRVRRAVGYQHSVHKEDTVLHPSETTSAKELPDYNFSQEMLNPETRKRQAQDKLLMLQLEQGVLPETFIKPASDPEFLTIDLSNYGIGDVRGLCLGGCIEPLDRLQSVGLSDNRLSSLAIPAIVKNLCATSVMHLDLSFNLVHDQGAKALASYFRGRNILSYLDISNCGVTCSDIKIICHTLTFGSVKNELTEMYLSCNKIAVEGASALCQYLSSKTCCLSTLDLSWNNIAEQGAIEFSSAMCHNTSLVSLNLASNSMNDHGGQRFANSIAENKTIVDINLSQNNISNCTCFVVAKVLKGHPSMQKLDLSLNPLGENGSRAIFRTILRGLRCFVIMRGCSYKEDVCSFNNTYPSLDNPYVLDLSEPYKAAVLNELLIKLKEDPVNCNFEAMTYQESLKSAVSQVSLVVVNDRVVLKSSGEPYVPPSSGFVKFSFQQSVFVPQLSHAIDEKALNILQIIVENGRTEVDRKLWLQLLCQDIYFTTAQARGIIERFKKNKTIGSGGLSVLDIIKSLWKFLLDTENMFDFLYENADSEQRRDLLHSLTMKRYKFNWRNPTGHWRLNLEDKTQRSIMMQIIAINNSESEYSRLVANREDTSQMGNWFNFRNEKYTLDRVTTERVIDKEFVKNVPTSGTVDFDYVSTNRPLFVSSRVKTAGTPTAAAGSNMSGFASGLEINTSTPRSHKGANMRQSVIPVDVVSEDDFSAFVEKLGLSSRVKIKPAAAMFILLDMQLASTKYYFSVKQVHTILDSFTDETDIQSKVIICLFSRIKDLHNLDILIRYLDKKAQQEIIKRLGCLNVLNPLKISFDYVLSLKFLDNRILLVALMVLASIESADCIIEDPSTELPLATMYGAYTRALNDTRPEVMKFTYTDFGMRTNNVSWSSRRELIKKFLVGSQPVDDSLYQVVMQYKELETAGALTTGPIDLQYGTYQKNLKSTPARSGRTNKQIVGLMRGVGAMSKK